MYIAIPYLITLRWCVNKEHEFCVVKLGVKYGIYFLTTTILLRQELNSS